METASNNLATRKRRQVSVCALGGTVVFLLFPPQLKALCVKLQLSGVAEHLILMCPVHLTLIALFFIAAKKLVPEEPCLTVLKLRKTSDYSFAKVLGFFCTMFFTMLAISSGMWIIEHFFSVNFTPQPLVSQAQSGSLGVFIAIVLTSVILAPISEELFFRGVLFRFFRNFLSPKEATFAGAAIFAVMHWNVMQFLSLFVMGLFLQTAYNKTRTLRTCILMHMANNLITVLYIFVLRYVGNQF